MFDLIYFLIRIFIAYPLYLMIGDMFCDNFLIFIGIFLYCLEIILIHNIHKTNRLINIISKENII